MRFIFGILFVLQLNLLCTWAEYKTALEVITKIVGLAEQYTSALSDFAKLRLVNLSNEKRESFKFLRRSKGVSPVLCVIFDEMIVKRFVELSRLQIHAAHKSDHLGFMDMVWLASTIHPHHKLFDKKKSQMEICNLILKHSQNKELLDYKVTKYWANIILDHFARVGDFLSNDRKDVMISVKHLTDENIDECKSLVHYRILYPEPLEFLSAIEEHIRCKITDKLAEITDESFKESVETTKRDSQKIILLFPHNKDQKEVPPTTRRPSV